jgi:hypothetical protein
MRFVVANEDYNRLGYRLDHHAVLADTAPTAEVPPCPKTRIEPAVFSRAASRRVFITATVMGSPSANFRLFQSSGQP